MIPIVLPGGPAGTIPLGQVADISTSTGPAQIEHLDRSRNALAELAKSRTQEDDLSEALTRAVALLVDIESDFASSTTLDTRKLEDSLTGLERMLNDSMFSVATTTTLEELKNGIKEQLKPYRSQMEAAVYKQTFDNLLLKRLREQFGVPRLSLFYVCI